MSSSFAFDKFRENTQNTNNIPLYSVVHKCEDDFWWG